MPKPKIKSESKTDARQYSVGWQCLVPDPENFPNSRVWHLAVNERAVNIASFVLNPELNLSVEMESLIVNNMTMHFVDNINLETVMDILYNKTTH
jgi:hypothetical protein